MNHSLQTANRETHIRIVAISLVASIAVVLGAAFARTEISGGLEAAHSPGVIIARPVIYASNAETTR